MKSDIFSDQWMQKLMQEWNKEPELASDLANLSFNSTIAYGFKDEDKPRAILVIEKGKAVIGGNFNSDTCDWDLRASKEDWKSWFHKPPGMMVLGMAYTSRKLKFNKGDYTSMIKDPRMAAPFLKSFVVMGRI